MRRIDARIAILFLGPPLGMHLGSILACHSPLRQPTSRATSMAASAEVKPAVNLAELAKRVPIVRNTRFSHPPPTHEQLQRVLRKVMDKCPEEQKVWFICLHANWKVDGERRLVLTVYFTPTETSGRIRKGRFVHVNEQFEEFIEEVLANFSAPDDIDQPGNEDETPEYWQVSLAGEPFSDELATPQRRMLPFPRPVGFTDQEVVEIVDFVRASHKALKAFGKAIPTHVRKVASQPILAIERKEGGVIAVRTGTQEGILSGSGKFLHLRRQDDGRFVIVSWGSWVS